ncbi:hypothetical protein PMAYCL1PPCAC_21414, partial [Pristionchus mayeri]
HCCNSNPVPVSRHGHVPLTSSFLFCMHFCSEGAYKEGGWMKRSMHTSQLVLLLLVSALPVYYCITAVPAPLPVPVLPQWCWGGDCDCPRGYHCVFFPSPLPTTTSYPFPVPRGICVINCPGPILVNPT